MLDIDYQVTISIRKLRNSKNMIKILFYWFFFMTKHLHVVLIKATIISPSWRCPVNRRSDTKAGARVSRCIINRSRDPLDKISPLYARAPTRAECPVNLFICNLIGGKYIIISLSTEHIHFGFEILHKYFILNWISNGRKPNISKNVKVKVTHFIRWKLFRAIVAHFRIIVSINIDRIKWLWIFQRWSKEVNLISTIQTAYLNDRK